MLIDENGMKQTPMKLIVEGYFTLSNKVITIDNSVSNSIRRKIFGGILKETNYVHTILIGQLGKYIGTENIFQCLMRQAEKNNIRNIWTMDLEDYK